MKSLLPIIFVILALSGAITYSLSKRLIPKREEIVILTPTVTPSVTAFPTPTPKAVISPLPAVVETGSETKGGLKVDAQTVTKISKEIVCTPVYGQANTCTEHIVVDTGAADAIFFNFAGLSYLAGLASFIFAKRA